MGKSTTKRQGNTASASNKKQIVTKVSKNIAATRQSKVLQSGSVAKRTGSIIEQHPISKKALIDSNSSSDDSDVLSVAEADDTNSTEEENGSDCEQGNSNNGTGDLTVKVLACNNHTKFDLTD